MDFEGWDSSGESEAEDEHEHRDEVSGDTTDDSDLDDIPHIEYPEPLHQAPTLNWEKMTPEKTFRPDTVEFIEPQSRFNNIVPIPLGPNSKPLDFLSAFLDAEIMDEILDQTNNFAGSLMNKKPNAFKNWNNVTIEELWVFFGLNLLMGLTKKPTVKDYWSTDDLIATPKFGKMISRERFEMIQRVLHFCDNDSEPRTSKLWKLGSFLGELLGRFRHCINLGEELCIDESLLAFKGRLSIKQYMPLKRSRFGIKYFSLVDTSTGFLADLQVYLGKGSGMDSAMAKILGLGGSTVVFLLADHIDKGHRVVVDNYFNSPYLQEYLHRYKTYLLGTVRKNRKGLPQFVGKLKRGECVAYFTDNLMVERWSDRREVYMLSSFLKHEMRLSTSTYPRNTRMKPNSVLHYNKKMGGVDTIDQVTASYSARRKCMKWYKKLAFHLIDLAVYNSFIVSKNFNVGRLVRFQEFLQTLIKNIFDTYPVTRSKIGRPRVVSQEITQKENHYPKEVIADLGKIKRSNCVMCQKDGKRKATSFECAICKKRLCVKGPASCFKTFHKFNQ